MSRFREWSARLSAAYDRHPVVGLVVGFLFTYALAGVVGIALGFDRDWWLVVLGPAIGSAVGTALARRWRRDLTDSRANARNTGRRPRDAAREGYGVRFRDGS